MRGGRAVLAHLFRLDSCWRALHLRPWTAASVRSLYVAHVGVPLSRIPIVTGVLFSLGAMSAAFGHHLAGRLMNRRPARTVIVTGTLLAAVAVAVIIVAPSLWFVGAAMLLFGVSVGVSTTTIYAVAGSSLPPDAHATGFGIMTTASLMGLAVSPVVAGFIGGSGLRMVFVADVLLLVVVGTLTWSRLGTKPVEHLEPLEPVEP